MEQSGTMHTWAKRIGATRRASGQLWASTVPLMQAYDVALLDLDGVVYLGSQVISGAPESLAAARTQGMRLAFVTNNAARPSSVVAAHLTELGIPAQESDITNSAQTAARYLAERLPAGAHVLVVGTVGLYEALTERDLVPVSVADEKVAAVVQGYSPELNWRQLAEGAVAIAAGLPWVATNADATVPSPRGPLPGNGSTVAALQHATGVVPIVTGKPNPTMHRESLLRSGAERPLVVGDRLDTDIEGANAAQCPSLLVFSGVTDPRQVVRAPRNSRPNYLGLDLSALLAAHPASALSDDASRCGPWLGRFDGQSIELSLVGESSSQSADGLDALRALAALSWQLADGGVEPQGFRGLDSDSRSAVSDLALS